MDACNGGHLEIKGVVVGEQCQLKHNRELQMQRKQLLIKKIDLKTKSDQF